MALKLPQPTDQPDQESKCGKKMTVRLFPKDLEALKEYFPRTGYNIVIRNLVHQYVSRLEAERLRALKRRAVMELNESMEAIVPKIQREKLEETFPKD